MKSCQETGLWVMTFRTTRGNINHFIPTLDVGPHARAWFVTCCFCTGNASNVFTWPYQAVLGRMCHAYFLRMPQPTSTTRSILQHELNKEVVGKRENSCFPSNLLGLYRKATDTYTLTTRVVYKISGIGSAICAAVVVAQCNVRW
jgi:hypothetical protein